MLFELTNIQFWKKAIWDQLMYTPLKLALLELPCCLISFVLFTQYNSLIHEFDIFLDKNKMGLLKNKAVPYSAVLKDSCVLLLFLDSYANNIVVFKNTFQLQNHFHNNFTKNFYNFPNFQTNS